MNLDWLQSLTPQQVTLIGIPLGFLSLAGGALINSWLNRRRDDRLRRLDTLSVATALLTELKLQRDALERNATSLADPDEAGDASYAFIPEPITLVWDAILPRLTLLDAVAIEKALYAFGTLPVYMDSLALQMGEVRNVSSKRQHVSIPVSNAPHAAQQTKAVMVLFDDAIAATEATIRRLRG